MIGNEKIHPDAKFIELFRRVGKIEELLNEIVERQAEIYAVMNHVPEGLKATNNRKTLELKSGTR